ncbi:hypothetical protein SNE40_003479 [Patella caerulea]|uniref:Uncharacterized protein n=1 Tax=Patella caerulea TaxID=87958 RepID=A0AAN8K332_PATCE
MNIYLLKCSGIFFFLLQFRKRSGLLQKRKSVDETQFDAEKLFRFLLYNLRQEERKRLQNSSPLNMLGLRSNRILSQEQSR